MEVKDSNQNNDISQTKNESLNQIENKDNKIEVVDTQNDKIQQENIENNNEEEQKIKTEIKKSKRKTVIIVILTLLIIALAITCVLLFISKNKKENIENNYETEIKENEENTQDENESPEDIENNEDVEEEIKEEIKEEIPIVEEKEEPTNKEYTSGPISSNELEDFDLYFLQVENYKKNKVYSPLAIKIGLKMLEEASNGATKEQISNIIGKYSLNNYTNSKNMSLANALFVRNSYKDSINPAYIDKLKLYNAEVIYDSFSSTKNINNWVSNKTFNTIKNFIEDVSEENFVLLNTVSIDMEWKNKIQEDGLWVSYQHEDYEKYINPLYMGGLSAVEFQNISVPAGEIGAVGNKYDIIKTLGEDKIRNIIVNDYQNWLNEGMPNSCGDETRDANAVATKFIEELKTNYGQFEKSTDFYFYTDNNVKVFAKDLKTYNDVTLQYIGILPKKLELKEYISIINSSNINTILKGLKPAEMSSFKEGKITDISGYIPFFQIDYDMNLKENLKRMGINDIYDSSKSDLSGITSEKAFITSSKHKTKIDFSNDGIKAVSAIASGGGGAGECGYDYKFQVPVEKIDLTFDKPYLFIVRDKNTNEVWYIGTVYKPLTEYPKKSIED